MQVSAIEIGEFLLIKGSLSRPHKPCGASGKILGWKPASLYKAS
jgi:hypothetical protein